MPATTIPDPDNQPRKLLFSAKQYLQDLKEEGLPGSPGRSATVAASGQRARRPESRPGSGPQSRSSRPATVHCSISLYLDVLPSADQSSGKRLGDGPQLEQMRRQAPYRVPVLSFKGFSDRFGSVDGSAHDLSQANADAGNGQQHRSCQTCRCEAEHQYSRVGWPEPRGKGS